jgi:tRNA threonylcarbamoyladenosine biosynthesis protein TsaB
MIISLDTASPVPAVAVLRDGALFQRRLSLERRASEDLLPALTECLEDAGADLSDCDRIAVCSGPGSFTGIRIGLATAWGLRRALGVALEAVPTLEAMAEAAREIAGGPVATVLNAGRGEVVLGRFELDAGRARPLLPPRRMRVEDAAAAAGTAAIFSLPAGLVPGANALPGTPCAALAFAVAREPRETEQLAPAGIYARPSAAEEKRGAS